MTLESGDLANAYRINDSYDDSYGYSDARREDLLQSLFAKNGDEIEFIN